MSFQVTQNAQDKIDSQNKKPSLVLEIDGYDYKFSLSRLDRVIRVGDVGLTVDGSWVIGGTRSDESLLPYISLEGTTQSISQQMQQDKGGASSVSSIQVSIIDYREKVTELVSPGFVLDDLLGRSAWVYLGFQDTLFPEDHVIIFSGIIDEISATGNITLNIAHPEQLKRQEIFISTETALNGGINSIVTTITLDSVENFLSPYSTEFLTYVKIDDEIIRYTGINTGLNQLTGCTRAQFGTVAASHSDDASVSSFYRLIGSANDLALKVLMSGPDEYWVEDIPVGNFVRSAAGVDTADTIFIPGVDIKQKYGVNVGDYLTTTLATNSANNVSLETISSIEITDDGSIITASGAGFVLEVVSSALIKFKSQYNVLPDGLGLGGSEVDVEEFNRINTIFASYMPDFDFYLTSTVNGKEFLDKEILYPANMFSLPRKGRVSLGVVSPPLAVATLPVIDASNIIQPEKISIKRTIGRYFYNTVIYKYDFDAVETDKPLAGYIRIDEDSKNRIKKVGTKSLVINSKGLRNTADTTTILDINTQRVLDRYKFAAEMFNISVFYGIGYLIEVGDIVYFGDENLRILDSKNGRRGFEPRLCEIVDKKMNIATGRIDLTLVDTNYSTEGRYGIFSPASIVGVGSTPTELVITSSYGTAAYELEKDKWTGYIGENLLIHDANWTTTYNTVLRGFDPSDPTIMLIDSIGVSLSAGFIVEIEQYSSSSNPEDSIKYKSIHCYFNPTISVASGTSNTVFSVGAGDVSKLFVGATIMVHDDDFSDYSPEVKVTDIVGTTVTVSASLGFTPSSSHYIEYVGFSSDEGPAYRWL